MKTNVKKVAVKKSVKKIASKKVTSKKTVKNKIKKTYVAFVLDNSGSMDSIKTETISAFNDQIDKLKKVSKNIETCVSLTTFDSYINEVVFNEPVEKLIKLTDSTYIPQLYTAMYDGVGHSIDSLEKLNDINNDDVSILMLIISDGQENASVKYNKFQIAEKIKKLTDTNRWTFTYLGANQDLSVISRDLNIPLANTLQFQASSAGVNTASQIVTSSLGSYYNATSSGESCVRGFYNATQDDPDLKK